MEIIERIVKKAIDEFAMQLAEKNVTLRVEDDVIRYLAIKGYSREFGARNISRLVEDQIKTVFVDEVLFGRLEHGGTAIARLENDKIVFDISPKNDS
jgi:ATP-dependent Clp protease ATP-binding subunit ClpA